MRRLIACLFALVGASACVSIKPIDIPTLTPFVPDQESLPTPAGLDRNISAYIDPMIPTQLGESISLPARIKQADNPEEAEITFSVSGQGDVWWLFVVVARFPTVRDSIAFEDLKGLWEGSVSSVGEIATILVSQKTQHLVENILGAHDPGTVQVMQVGLLERAWSEEGTIAIIPFEELDYRWKVLSLDGKSPLYKDLDLDSYPLVIRLGWVGAQEDLTMLIDDTDYRIQDNNWDTGKMTTLMLTGTSALVRSVAERMETKGLLYPAELIRDWLLEPDFTHISNEVSFTPDCPEPDPWLVNLMFCSQPEYLSLLEDIDVDIIELTGNHLADYNYEPISYTLEQYRQRGWWFYGGGADDFQARQPLLIDHNGNRVALLGCNTAGPEWVWATPSNPGAAQCDFDWLAEEISRLKKEGYLVFLTLQGDESYDIVPVHYMQTNFHRAADMGADVVSGSQAHFPQVFHFLEGAVIHYGLGNLFFDQMDYPVVGTRREFLDRYVIYEGKLISVEIKTAMLEDWAQPRPMSEAERTEFLTEIFTSSIWQ